MEPAAEVPPQPRWPLAALACITLAGLALRLTNIGESFWLDELHTGWVVKDAWNDVAWRAQIGNQSPVWFYAVKLITTLGGESELTLRLLSLVAGTALIPTVYFLVCHWLASADAPTKSQLAPDSNSPPATSVAIPSLLAASLIAIDPNCIFYATEARPYACLQLCAAVQLGLFWQILQAPTTKLRIGWMLLTALAFHLHYTGILILLGELVVMLCYYLLSRKPVPYRLWRALFDWQIAAMLCLPAIGHVLEVAQRRQMWDSTTAQASWLSSFTLFSLYSTLALGLIVCAVAVVRWFRVGNPFPPQARGTALETVASWFFVPILAAVATLAIAHLDLALPYLRRYLIAFAIGPPLLTALLLSRLPQWWLRCAVAAIVIGAAAYHSNIIPQLRYDGRAVGERNENWRRALAWLREQHALTPAPIEVYSRLLEDDVTIQRRILNSGYSEQQLQEYLLFPLHSLYPGPPAAPEQRGRIKWIVVRGGDRGMSCILDGYDLATLGCDRVQEQSFGNVRVSLWQRCSPDEEPSPTSPQSPASDP